MSLKIYLSIATFSNLYILIAFFLYLPSFYFIFLDYLIHLLCFFEFNLLIEMWPCINFCKSFNCQNLNCCKLNFHVTIFKKS